MQIDYGALGARIRAARRARGITQEQLAELADVSTPFIGHVERGTRIPSLETLVSICYALDIMPNDLLADSLPENGFVPPRRRTTLRSAWGRLRNTLSAWLGFEPDEADDAQAEADLSTLPPLEFGVLEENAETEK